mmetsp:Transcript_3210/g.4704  ORF Transcript_3210/g.4704 Transcript_3210/m.4704 type:complete len:408 (+) Transcript_3210:182-1405(+)
MESSKPSGGAPSPSKAETSSQSVMVELTGNFADLGAPLVGRAANFLDNPPPEASADTSSSPAPPIATNTSGGADDGSPSAEVNPTSPTAAFQSSIKKMAADFSSKVENLKNPSVAATGTTTATATSNSEPPKMAHAATIPPTQKENHQQQDPLSEELEEEEEVLEDGDEEDEEDESSEISASDEEGSWIAWFCSLRGNEFFCDVEEDYIQDNFNLTGLSSLVPYYEYALDMVLDVEMPMEDSLTEEQQEIVESAAEMLYGLIHARYILTNRGMHAMYEKYRTASFGRCPSVFCQGQPVLPVGLSDLPRNYTVNVYCPRCRSIFFPKSTRQANIDGAYFGTTFPHLYLVTHPDMVPLPPVQTYVPRIYGFKIHETSAFYRNPREGLPSLKDGDKRQKRKGKHRQGSKR